MIFTKSHIFKILFITMVFCCLVGSIFAGKLSKTVAVANGTEIVASDQVEPKLLIKFMLNETESKTLENFEEEDRNDVEHVDKDDDAAEKNAMQPIADKSLSVWRFFRSFWSVVEEDISERLFGANDDGSITAVGEGRTFGKIRRLQMALIPIVFKFGVLFAMVTFLVAISLKNLLLVKVLIVMNLIAITVKLLSLKANIGHVEHVVAPVGPPWDWAPTVNSGWQSSSVEHVPQPHSNKEIHLHVHGGHWAQSQVSGLNNWERRVDPYRPYESVALQGHQNGIVPNELFIAIGNGMQKYNIVPSNHPTLYNGISRA